MEKQWGSRVSTLSQRCGQPASQPASRWLAGNTRSLSVRRVAPYGVRLHMHWGNHWHAGHTAGVVIAGLAAAFRMRGHCSAGFGFSYPSTSTAACAAASYTHIFDQVLGEIQSVVPSQFSVLDVPADGNCLFHAIAQSHSIASGRGRLSLPQSKHKAKQLRLQANDVLCPDGTPSQADYNGIPLSLTIEPIGGESGRGYCARLRQDSQWGSAAEILALSMSLQCPIVVYHRVQGSQMVVLDTYGRGQPGPQVCFA